MTTRLGRIAVWAALAGALALAVAFVWMRLSLPSDGARIPFYDEAWTTQGVLIAPIDAPAPGLEDGDLVAAVGGRSMDAWLGGVLDPAIERPAATTPISYDLIRDQRPVVAAVDWSVQPLGATLLAGWSVIAFSVAVVIVAAFVFWKRPDASAALALMIAAAAAAGSSVPWFLGVTPSGVVGGVPFVLLAILTGPLYMLLWPAGIHLALAFPERSGRVARHPWLIPAAYVVVMATYGAAMAVARLGTTSIIDWVGTWPIVQASVIVPSLIVTLALFARTYRATRDAAARTRLRWAWLGLVAGAAVGLVGFMVPVLVTGQTLLPESWIGLSAMPVPLGVAVGILRDRLFGIDVVVRRTFVYGGMTLGVVAIYVAVVSAMTAAVGTEPGFGGSLLATGVAALVAIPLRDGLQRIVTRFLYGDRGEPWRAIRRLGQRLDLAADPDRVFPAVTETVADALRLPYVALELIGDDGRPHLASDTGRSTSDVTTLPIVDGQARVGTLVLGHRAGEGGFRADELELLADLARQAGATIHALRLQADLARSHERLLLTREEERRRLRRDLHDGLGPTLAAIGMRAEASAELIDTRPDESRRQLAHLSDDVRLALADLRRLVDGLRPPALDDLGLVGAIAAQAERLEGPTHDGPITLTVEGSPDPLPDLPAAVEVAAFRIASEALTNAVRHAGAQRCTVRIVAGDRLELEVTDDGRGLPAAIHRGTGLESMEARATELGGSLVVEPRAGGGTRLRATLPISGGAAPALEATPDALGASAP